MITTPILTLLICSGICLFLTSLTLILLFLQRQRLHQLTLALHSASCDVKTLSEELRTATQQTARSQATFQNELQKQLYESQIKSLQQVMQQLQHMQDHIHARLKEQAQENATHMEKLTQTTDTRLQHISGQVEQRLTAGFEKTTATFTAIMQRLTIIDEAQKKISDLSNDVVSLQEVLIDKRSRGAFGEVQLTALVRNVIPEQHVSWQHTLSNGKRPDCVLFLPKPTGKIVIDAKFPLENFAIMQDSQRSQEERNQALAQFRLDMKEHIKAIAEKYIIPQETSDGAILFIPSESIFAEIHAHHPELVELAHRERVWLTSPTTLMAILTTARAVLKDEVTRKQVHIIQEHLVMLSKDFSRFQKRMDNLAKHIDLAKQDVSEVHTSAKKISRRFSQIEEVDVNPKPIAELSDEV